MAGFDVSARVCCLYVYGNGVLNSVVERKTHHTKAIRYGKTNAVFYMYVYGYTVCVFFFFAVPMVSLPHQMNVRDIIIIILPPP